MKKFPILIGILLCLCLGLCACGEEQVQAQSFSVTYTSVEGGKIEGEKSQIVEAGMDGSLVMAVPAEGYRFEGWSDGLFTPSRQEKDVRENLQFIAFFSALKAPNEPKEPDKPDEPQPPAEPEEPEEPAEPKVKQFSVKYEAGVGGRIEGEAEQTVEDGQSTTAVTAVPEEGYEFLEWSDGLKDATRQENDVRAYYTFRARFQKKCFKVVYQIVGTNCTLKIKDDDRNYSKFTEKIYYGEDAPEIWVNPEGEDFFSHPKFVYWSDGLQTRERHDTHITQDMEITAYCGFYHDYSVENNEGGKILGNLHQIVLEGEPSESVTAVADEGYVFTGWSDLASTPEHDMGILNQNFEVRAYFERIERTFSYDYGSGYQSPMKKTVTIERDKIKEAKFVVPSLQGYTFCGWFADEKYEQKVVSEDGNLMLGYYTFTLDTDTLYAKWEKDGEENLPDLRVLFVMTDEVHAKLYSNFAGKDVLLDYKMTGLERKYLIAISQKFREILKEWFEEKVEVYVEVYFTKDPIGTKDNRIGEDDLCIEPGPTKLGTGNSCSINANYLPELGSLMGKYHSILCLYGFNEYEYTEIIRGGESSWKYAKIPIAGFFDADVSYHQSLIASYEKFLKTDIHSEELETSSLEICLHEFTHTIEQTFSYGEILGYHKAIELLDASWKITRKYLLHELEIDGEKFGIPPEFWEHKLDVGVNLVPRSLDKKSPGKIDLVGFEDHRKPWDNYIVKDVPYGSDLTFEAVPFEGYRFVRWSDGVTSARRTEKNIISYLNLKAIFEKIN